MTPKWLISWLLLLSCFSLIAQEKEPIPEPSKDPFLQAKYLAYKRDMKEAAESLSLAQAKYKSTGDMDSLSLTMLARARMLTLTRKVDESEGLVDSALVILSLLKDTLPYTKALLPFVQTGNYFVRYNIAKADSMGRLALRRIDDAVGGCHFIMINMLNDHGIVQFYKGDYLKGDSLVTASLECANRIYYENDMRKIPSLNLGGTIKDFLGYHRESIEIYKMALSIMEENDRDESYDYARIMNNMAGAIYDNGGPLEAIKIYEKSLALTENFDDIENNRAAVYYNIANMLNSIGYRNKALDYIEMSIDALEEKNDAQTPTSYLNYVLKATILALLDRYGEAEQELSKAKDIINNIYADDAEVKVEFLRRQASVLTNSGKMERSLEIIDSTIQLISERELDVNGIDRGEIFYLGGETALLDQDYEQAYSYYQKSVVDFLAGSPRQQKQAALSLSKMGEVLLKDNQWREAEKCVLQSDSILLGTSTSSLLGEQSALEDYLPLQHLRDVLYVKIKLLLNRYESTKDENYLIRALESCYVLEQEINDKASVYLEEEDAVGRTSEYYQHYGIIVKIRLLAAKVLNRLDLAESALNTVESTKDLLYKNALRSVAQPVGIVPDSILILEQRIKSNIDLLKENMVEARLNGDTIDASQAELYDAERKWDEYKLSVQSDFPEYFNQRFKEEVLDMENIQAQLVESNSTIVQYFLEDEFSCAFVINKDSIAFVELEKNTLLEPLLKKTIEDIRSTGPLNSLNLCYRSFFKPIEGYVHTENVVVIPDGFLHFVPFEAFRNARNEFLIEKYNFTYNHSLGSTVSKTSAPQKLRLLSVAPGFDKSVMDLLRQSGAEYPLSDIVRQPNAIRLSQSAVDNIPGQRLNGVDASELKFKEEVGNSNILLIATHAKADEAHPLFSKISLLPDSQNIEDGLLHAYEVMSFSLDHELAILSACETGLGELDRGQGASSLSQAFRVAGCENVLMSLWSIDEKQSIKLLDDFLKEISLGGDFMSAALTKTKRKYLENATEELSHPFYWSGLVLVGPDEVVADNSYFTLKLLIGFLLLLALLVFLIKRYSRRNL